ncbi:uncharacterized protein LOC131039397 isoform X1 [Cryptomeria japonica]|uniref:uncharacterized protein LOC131039397 isoform X1 n=2 Tax=Cryptomeria japonica TaxID=3369 RepID=UPI0027DA8581|nr:uncharacterized protein LOC131039397 isoform X1 [Cryptomeria japonica]XP_057828111.2 uncharacterized protein LOC131039397 isoform X1 [Cryptomeria japonica]
MALSYWDDEEEDEYDAMGNEFDEDMDALKRACQLTGEDHRVAENASEAEINGENEDEDEDDDDDADDSKFLYDIQNRLMSGPARVQIPLIKGEIEERPLDWYTEEDDEDILKEIRNRFADSGASIIYGTHGDDSEVLRTQALKYDSRTVISAKHELCNDELGITLLDQVFDEDYATSRAIIVSQNSEISDDRMTGKPSNGCVDADASGPLSSNVVPGPKYAGIPGYARALLNALKKNRLCQKNLRSKLLQIEVKMEENKELRNRVKCLVDFQNACKRRLRQLLSQDTDSTFKLIACPKARSSSSKLKETADTKVTYRCCGPPENEDVAKYNMVQKSFPTTVERKKWSKKERDNLGKGVKQQMQETLVRQSMELLKSDENFEDANHLDEQILAISQAEVSPENIRSFLPHVDWERLASTYVAGHSGADCEARWLNNEDPLINFSPWTKVEDKKLLMIVQNNGLHNWVQISNMLGTNRTSSQCLSRYQRSLNAHIMRKDWTDEEDDQLRAVVETFGENDWQIVAANMEGRTGAQCLNRWCKSILPDRKKVGRWTVEEDKRLKVAVLVYGPRMWKKIASFVPGRTEVQCRERWCNVLDPSIKLEGWTEEEDAKLESAVSLYGYCWSKVAISVPPRTDNQCRRRWKVLHPQELAAAQKARKIRKAALISNFVGRNKERPTIGPNDFFTEFEGGSCSEGNVQEEPCAPLAKKRRRQHVKENNVKPSAKKRKKSHRTAQQKDLQNCSEDFSGKKNRDRGHCHSEGVPTAMGDGGCQPCPKTDRRTKRKKWQAALQKETSNSKIDDGGTNKLQTLSALDVSSGSQLVLYAPGQTQSLICLDQVGNSWYSNPAAKRVTQKRTRSCRKPRSVNQKMDGLELVKDKMTVPADSEGIFVANAELHASLAKSDKSDKIKQTKSFRKHGASNQQRDGDKTMQLATTSICDSGSLQHLISITNSHVSGTTPEKHGQGDTISMISDQAQKISADSIKSSKILKQSQGKPVKKLSDTVMHRNGMKAKSANRAKIAKHKRDEQGALQVMMPTAIEQVNLIIGDKSMETYSNSMNSKKVAKKKLAERVTKDSNKVICEKENQTESVCRENGPVIGQAENDQEKNKIFMQFTGKDNSGLPNEETDIGQDENVAIAARTLSSLPSSFDLENVLSNKYMETMDHNRVSKQREDSTSKLVGAGLQSDFVNSNNQQTDIEMCENDQNKNQKLVLSNVNSIEIDMISQALADKEMAIKRNISEGSKQVDNVQQRRTRRTTRRDFNYKDLLNGNICIHTHRN